MEQTNTRIKDRLLRGGKRLLVPVAILIVILIITLIMTLLSSGKKDGVVYKHDPSGASVKLDKEYSIGGTLITIPTDAEDSGETPVYVETLQGSYPASINKGVLYYIGKAPTEDNPIIRVVMEEIETKQLSREDFMPAMNNTHMYNIPTDDTLRNVTITNEKGEPVPLEWKSTYFSFVLDNESFVRSGSYNLIITKGKEINL